MISPSDVKITIAEQIACVDRELGMRRRVYPRWVERGKLNPATADLEIKRMEAVKDSLRRVQTELPDREPGATVGGDLFGPAKVRKDEREKVLRELSNLMIADAMYKLDARLQRYDKQEATS